MQFVLVGLGGWFHCLFQLRSMEVVCFLHSTSHLVFETVPKLLLAFAKKKRTLGRRCFVPTYFVLQILWQFPSCIFLCESKFPDARYAEFFEPRNHVLNYIIGC